MCKGITLEELKEIQFDDETSNRASYRGQSKEICIIAGYLLGVKEEYLQKINDDESIEEIINKLKRNENAKAIRHLNNIRSNIMLNFKTISRETRISAAVFTPIYNHEKLKDDFKELSRLDINISTGRQDLNEYITIINKEIMKRINSVKVFFPEWIDFKHIVVMFNMPSDIKAESEHFQANQNCYPFKRYFYWKNPVESGNILAYDLKFLDIIYRNNFAHFEAINKVTDASETVKDNIHEFIQNGRKIQIFIDGENVDPYRFASAIDGLQEYEIEKIDKIVVYYDSVFSERAWTYLQHFTFGVPVEAVPVERIKKDKSLVDHKLVVGVSKAVYADNVDSIILASSDSDFWAVIEDVKAKYLVMVETDKCGFDFKSILREHNIFYCYLDRFIATEDDKYFKTVFKHELENAIADKFVIPDAEELFKEAFEQTRAEVPQAELDALFDKYIGGLKLKLNKEKKFEIVLFE